MPSDPYCSNCGYKLVGLTESSKCPECGRPIVEVLMRDSMGFVRGRRYRSDTVLFGLPLVDVAFGPHENERFGRARGIFAVGDVALGWFAIGGRAIGLVAIGGFSVGLVSLGGAAFGLMALGGSAIGGATAGGAAIGLLAQGGGAVGLVAQAGGAVGYYARAGGAIAAYAMTPMRRDPEAVRFFDDWGWLFGNAGVTGMGGNFIAWLVVAMFLTAVLIAGIVGLGLLGRRAGGASPGA